MRSSAEEVAKMRFLVLGAEGEMVRVRSGDVWAEKRKVSVKVVGREISSEEAAAAEVCGGMLAMKPWRVFS